MQKGKTLFQNFINYNLYIFPLKTKIESGITVVSHPNF